MGSTGALGAQMARGIRWKVGSQAVMQVSRLAVGLALARMLSPEDFGVAALALTVVTGLQVLGDVGLGAALVQRERLTEAERSTAFWCTALLAAVLAGAMVLLARPAAAVFRAPELAGIVAALSAVVALNALSSVPKALLTRDLEFRALELRQLAATVTGAVAALALALGGAGTWAIAGQWIVTALVGAVLVWVVSPWRPRLLVDRAALRSLGGFGMHVTGTQVLFFLNRSTDNVIVGRVLGASALGAYNVAYQLMLFPLTQVAGIVADVLYPVLSRLQDDAEALRRTWLLAARRVTAVCAPLMLGAVVVAGDLVPVLLGPGWDAAVPVVQVLAPVGLLQSVQRFNSGVLQARGRTRDLLRFSVVAYAAAVVGILGGVGFGLAGVAIGYAAATVAVAPVYLRMTVAAAGGTAREAVWAVSGPLAAGAAAAAGAALAGWAAGTLGADGHLERLLLAVAAGAVAYLAALRVCASDVWDDAVAALPRRRRRAGARAPLTRPA